jgi:hypothetical protein
MLAGNQGRKVPNENTVGFTESEVNVVKDVPHYDVNGQAVASRKDRGEACSLVRKCRKAERAGEAEAR